jgi:2-keto-4-pentenoate hydratase/2-oxohepta-3-ene-1,7-dioic acid hydratase in catechol pathway
MKFVVFRDSKTPYRPYANYRIGALIDDETIADLTPSVMPLGLTADEVLRCCDLDSNFVATAVEAIAAGGIPTIARDDFKLESPVPRPGKIICIGLNYRNHAIESGMEIPKSPIIFSKFQTCVVGEESPILLPPGSEQVDYEAELAVIIGRRASRVKAEDAMSHVLGYTNFNDVSARDFQFADGQWQRGKSCDTFAPMGPYIATADEIPDPHDLRISFRLNGDMLQDSTTSELIFRIPELIEFISSGITLEPGDVIATGTPPGVGFARKPPVFLKDGDIAEVEIEGLGVLSNPVAG